MAKKKPATIYYFSLTDEMRKEEKLAWFAENKLERVPFEHVVPDKKNNWVSIAEESDWEKLVPLCSKDAKLGRDERSLFKLYTQGLKTNRNDWVYDYDKNALDKKVNFFMSLYNSEIDRWQTTAVKGKVNDFVDRKIKWTAELEDHLVKAHSLKYSEKKIVSVQFRPFVKLWSYVDRIITHRLYNNAQVYGVGNSLDNSSIFFSGIASTKPFQAIATNLLTDYDCLEKPQGVPIFRFEGKERLENITDWGLEQFHKKYKDKKITKENIFHYVYAVLHHPAYREKYALNLKRDFPRIPFYDDFRQWSEWGKQLMELHIKYEKVQPFPLKREEVVYDADPQESYRYDAGAEKAKLKADKVAGKIVLDGYTTLAGIPKEAWEYKLGNRSALEWILDQYKESKPKDPTIAAKFNTYKFADHKEHVIDLLQRVTTVSVETMKIIKQMQA